MKCPHCQSVLSTSEGKSGTCPICKSSLSGRGSGIATPPRSSAAASAPPTLPGMPPPGQSTVKSLKPGTRIGMRLGGAIALAVGLLFLLFIVGPEFSRWLASGSWPAANGKVIESGISEAVAKSRRGSTRTVYKPYVRYSYEVGGKQYENNRMSFGADATVKDDASAWMSESAAHRIAKKYRVDEPVKVYYNPADPDFSVLNRSMGISAWGTLGLSAFLCYLGIRLPMATFGSDEAAARSSIWLWERDLNYGDYVGAGVPLLVFGAAQFFPGFFH